MIATTDRERIQRLEAKVAELTADVAAWHLAEQEARKSNFMSDREDRVRRALLKHRPPGARGSRCGPAPVRLLILFLEHPGRMVSREAIYQTVVRDEDSEISPKNIDVRVCEIRNIIAWLGISRGSIETVWQRGYLLNADAASEISARLGIAEIPAVAA